MSHHYCLSSVSAPSLAPRVDSNFTKQGLLLTKVPLLLFPNSKPVILYKTFCSQVSAAEILIHTDWLTNDRICKPCPWLSIYILHTDKNNSKEKYLMADTVGQF